MKSLLFWSLLTVSACGFAAGGGHDDGHVPLDKIGWQAANLGILLAAIIFFIKGSIVEAFSKRRQDFVDQSEKTKVALKAAELALSDIKTRLAELEAGEQKSLENAKRESQAQHDALVRDAQNMVEKMKKDASLLVENEVAKAKAEINAAIINQAVAATAQKLSSGGAGAGTQDAQFIKQLEQVRA